MVHIKLSAAFILAVAAAMIAPAVALPVPNQFESHSHIDHSAYPHGVPMVGELGPAVASPVPKQLESHSVWPFSAGVHNTDPICLVPRCQKMGGHVLTPEQVAHLKETA